MVISHETKIGATLLGNFSLKSAFNEKLQEKRILTKNMRLHSFVFMKRNGQYFVYLTNM